VTWEELALQFVHPAHTEGRPKNGRGGKHTLLVPVSNQQGAGTRLVRVKRPMTETAYLLYCFYTWSPLNTSSFNCCAELYSHALSCPNSNNFRGHQFKKTHRHIILCYIISYFIILYHNITESTLQNHFWEAISRSTSHEISRLFMGSEGSLPRSQESASGLYYYYYYYYCSLFLYHLFVFNCILLCFILFLILVLACN
jgi:hypothetical protein